MNQEQPRYCIKHKPRRLTLISLGTRDCADYSVFMVQKWKDIVSLSLSPKSTIKVVKIKFKRKRT